MPENAEASGSQQTIPQKAARGGSRRSSTASSQGRPSRPGSAASSKGPADFTALHTIAEEQNASTESAPAPMQLDLGPAMANFASQMTDMMANAFALKFEELRTAQEEHIKSQRRESQQVIETLKALADSRTNLKFGEKASLKGKERAIPTETVEGEEPTNLDDASYSGDDEREPLDASVLAETWRARGKRRLNKAASKGLHKEELDRYDLLVSFSRNLLIFASHIIYSMKCLCIS